jgi:hypothetical protein
MVRTQVYLTKQQHAALQRAAARERLSMTEMLRRLIDRDLLARSAGAAYRKEAVLSFIGLGESGDRHGSAQHDRHLDAALRDSDLR